MPESPQPQRQVLPIPDRQHVGVTTYDAKDPDTSFPPIEPLRPPEGAPNVLVVLIDDAGFGASSAFGGPCQHADVRAAGGERAQVQPLPHDRAVLADPAGAADRPQPPRGRHGRHHRDRHVGARATARSGRTPRRPWPRRCKLNGYSTAQFGKCHEVPVWETSPMGPFDAWPTGGGGFEHFYGFIGGETNQYAPAIYEDTVPVEPDRTPEEGYHFTEDMTDQAIDWIRQQKALMPDKPFFVYFAPGATHAPHHVPTEWSDKYKGKFDQGWDELREETFARQKELGVIPEDAELTARPAEIPAWDDMPDDLKPVLARQMEVYAGLPGAHRPPRRPADRRARRPRAPRRHARLRDHRRQRRLRRRHARTAASTSSSSSTARPRWRRPSSWRRGSTTSARRRPTTTTRSAGRTRWTRRTSGPSRSPRTGAAPATARSSTGPSGIKAKGEVRHQFHHVIDVAADGPRGGRPARADVRQRRPADAPARASAWRYSFDDADAAERHETQYFEMFCNRGIYHQGWTAVTRHCTPWVMATELPPLDDDVWELYAPDDWTQAHDLAAEQPEKLARAAAAVPDRGGQVQRASRSTTAGSSGSTPTSPAGRS